MFKTVVFSKLTVIGIHNMINLTFKSLVAIVSLVRRVEEALFAERCLNV